MEIWPRGCPTGVQFLNLPAGKSSPMSEASDPNPAPQAPRILPRRNRNDSAEAIDRSAAFVVTYRRRLRFLESARLPAGKRRRRAGRTADRAAVVRRYALRRIFGRAYDWRQ